jgi:hypothetical protein
VSQKSWLLDGLLYHQSEVAARRHHTDGAIPTISSPSASLLGVSSRRGSPDLKSRRLYSFGKAAAYPSLEPLIAGRINPRTGG